MPLECPRCAASRAASRADRATGHTGPTRLVGLCALSPLRLRLIEGAPAFPQVEIDANGVLKLQHLLHVTRAPNAGGGGGGGAHHNAAPGMSGRDVSVLSSRSEDPGNRGVRTRLSLSLSAPAFPSHLARVLALVGGAAAPR